MCTYNEEDIIEATLHHAVSQGVEVHLVDYWSQTVRSSVPKHFSVAASGRLQSSPSKDHRQALTCTHCCDTLKA